MRPSQISGDNARPTVSEPDVSIIIVNWNLKDYLRECLESIEKFSDDVGVETIVVDNASADGSQEMVEREFPAATLIHNSDNIGFSRANNQAMDVARGRYFFLLNNDARLYEGALPGLVVFMDGNPGAGICGPRVVNDDGTLQVRSKGRYPSIASAFFHFFVPRRWQGRPGRPMGFYEPRDLMKTRQVDWVSGCALMARRSAVEEVGRLDADVFMYCEDVDWCYRMNRASWKVFYVPGATVMHHLGQSMKKQTGRKVGAHKAGLVAFHTKHHGATANLLFKAVLWAGYGLQALGWVLAALRGRGAGLDKLKRMLPGGRARSGR